MYVAIDHAAEQINIICNGQIVWAKKNCSMNETVNLHNMVSAFNWHDLTLADVLDVLETVYGESFAISNIIPNS